MTKKSEYRAVSVKIFETKWLWNWLLYTRIVPQKFKTIPNSTNITGFQKSKGCCASEITNFENFCIINNKWTYKSSFPTWQECSKDVTFHAFSLLNCHVTYVSSAPLHPTQTCFRTHLQCNGTLRINNHRLFWIACRPSQKSVFSTKFRYSKPD